jgi:hypothetical protein
VHLDGTLAMTDVVNFLFGYAIHIGKNGWDVIICHMLECEFPKLFIFIRIVFCVTSRMLIASAVS